MAISINQYFISTTDKHKITKNVHEITHEVLTGQVIEELVGLVLRLEFACFVYFYFYVLTLSVGRQSVSVSATVTAVTGLQLRRHFRLRPKPEKLVSVGL